MDEQTPQKKSPEPALVLPAADRPAMAAAAPWVPIGPGERQAMASGNAPVPLGPGERQAIAPASTPASLPASGAPALAAGTPPTDPLREQIAAILSSARTIAVVGASDKPGKPSHRVFFYLLHAGFEIYPVNPTFKELGGRPAFPDVCSIPVKLDIVDIFRRPEQVLPVVEEAIAVGAKAVWMQEGIVNEEAASRARGAGLLVIMDRCVMKEHRKMRNLPAEGQGR
jgi:hypothetical protein